MAYTQEQLQGFLTQVRTISEDIKNIDIAAIIAQFQGNVNDLADLLALIENELTNIENRISEQITHSIELESAINVAVAEANNVAVS